MIACEFGESGVQVLTQIADPDLLVSLLGCDPQPPGGQVMTERCRPALPLCPSYSLPSPLTKYALCPSSKAVLIFLLERSYFYPSAFFTVTCNYCDLIVLLALRTVEQEDDSCVLQRR